jgi:hypothetical protein
VRWIVLVTAVEAVATSLVLLASPPLFAWLVLGGELSESGEALARLTGIVLLAFGLVSWPAPFGGGETPAAIRAMLIYNLLATIYLIYLGLGAKLDGILLWPAVGLHAVLTLLTVHAWRVSTGRLNARRVTHPGEPHVIG